MAIWLWLGEHLLEIALGLVSAGALALSKNFHKQIKSYREIVRQNEEEKLDKKIDSKLDPLWADLEELRQYIITVGDSEKKHMNVIISSYRYRLIQLCKQFINQGYITPAQYE